MKGYLVSSFNSEYLSLSSSEQFTHFKDIVILDSFKLSSII